MKSSAAATALAYAAALTMVAMLGLLTMQGVQRPLELASVGGKATPQALSLAANLAKWKAEHPPVFKAPAAPRLRQHKLQQLSQTAPPARAAPQRAMSVSGALKLPAGVVLHALQPGQALPPGAVVVNVPQLAQAPAARQAAASASGPLGGREAGGVGGGAEQLAVQRRAAAHEAQATAKADGDRAMFLQQNAVKLIEKGWSQHEGAVRALAAAEAQEKQARAQLKEANKLEGIAKAYKAKEFAQKLKTIAASFSQAAAEQGEGKGFTGKA